MYNSKWRVLILPILEAICEKLPFWHVVQPVEFPSTVLATVECCKSVNASLQLPITIHALTLCPKIFIKVSFSMLLCRWCWKGYTCTSRLVQNRKCVLQSLNHKFPNILEQTTWVLKCINIPVGNTPEIYSLTLSSSDSYQRLAVRKKYLHEA